MKPTEEASTTPTSTTETSDVEMLVEQPTELKRGTWKWQDSFEILRMVEKHGKNWQKIVDQINNEQHRFTTKAKMDPDAVRKHYSYLKTSLNKPYKTPELRLAKKERTAMGAAAVRKLETEHATKHQRIRQERELGLAIVKKVEDRESLRNSNTNDTEDEIHEKMQKKAEERREILQERHKEVVKLANQEEELKNGMMKMYDTLTTFMLKSQQTQEKLLDLLGEDIAIKRARRM